MLRQVLQIVTAAALVLSSVSNAAADSSQTLTLTTYNIHSAIPNLRSNTEYVPQYSDLDNVANVLTTCGADIIGLQEVRSMWTLPVKDKPICPLDYALYLAISLDKNYAFGSSLDAVPGYPENRDYIQWGKPDEWTNNGARHGEYGNAILSRFDLAAAPTIISLPRGSDEVAREKGDEPRIALRAEFQETVPGFGPVVVYSTHFQHNNGNTRKMQMEHLLTVAKADTSTATVFLMGDFNHFPHEGEPDLLGMVKQAGFHDLAADYAAKTGTKPAATMQEEKRPERIDYIFCSKPVNVTNVTVLKSQVSDHLPVTVSVSAE